MNKYNIALTFNKEVSRKINTYSQLLCSNIESDFILGENATPHMTVAQFEVSDLHAKEIWNSCLKLKNTTPVIHFSGITILPSSNGGAWIEISVLKGKELLILQENVKNIINLYGSLKNDFGDMYRPHITVAHATKGNLIAKFPFTYDPLRLNSVQTHFEIGLGIRFEPLNIQFN